MTQATGVVDPFGSQAVIAHSQVMQDQLTAMRAAVKRRDSVLVCGERGSGRRFMARKFHRLACPDGAPFEIVDCAWDDDVAALRGALASTPAWEARTSTDPYPGIGSLLERVEGGTLFLANLEELPADLQWQLARLLSTQAGFRPVASINTGICATAMAGSVRLDLLQRLSGARIDMPALRRRQEDIPALAGLFLEDACSRRGVETMTFDSEAMALLKALPWHANAAEMRALTEALAIRVSTATVTAEDVLAGVTLEGEVRGYVTRPSLVEATIAFERQYLLSSIERHGGSMAAAAAELGLLRPNLYRKLRELGIRTGHAAPSPRRRSS